MRNKKLKDYVYPLKIEEPIIKRLKELAKKNRRTIRGEISIALENHLKGTYVSQ